MNVWDIALIAALVAIIALAARRMVLNKRQGKSSCGCDCGNCACGCHRREKDGP